MRSRYNRKTTPSVSKGKVKKKNNSVPTTHLGYVIDRKRPGNGFHHVVKRKEIHDFTDLIEDWASLSHRLEAVVLEEGRESRDGAYIFYHRERTGSIRLSAWYDDLWIENYDWYFQEHKWIYDELNVAYEKNEEYWKCYFTADQAKAFTLLHVFLHELGHHVGQTQSGRDTLGSSEEYAESFANIRFEAIWPKYVEKFGYPKN